MTTKITVIYDNPDSADVFEAGYPDQVELARKLATGGVRIMFTEIEEG